MYDEVEAMTSKAIVHDVLKPAGTFPDLKHLKGRNEHQRRARLPPAPRRRGDRRSQGATRVFEHTLPHPAGDAHAARAAGVGGRVDRELAHHPHRLAEPVVRAHRDRAPARLAGEPRARARAVPRRRLRRQALHQARGAGRGAVAAHAQAGEDLADDGGAVLHHHQARQHLPHQERRDEGRPHRRARVRGVVERRRLRRHRPARDAEVGLHRARARTTSSTSRSTRTRSTPTCRPPARCAASASRSWCGPTRATPT